MTMASADLASHWLDQDRLSIAANTHPWHTPGQAVNQVSLKDDCTVLVT